MTNVRAKVVDGTGDGPVGVVVRCPACLVGHVFQGGFAFNCNLVRPTLAPAGRFRIWTGWAEIPDEQWLPVAPTPDGIGLRVPYGMLDGAQVARLYNVSLDGLRLRGGLSAFEANALLSSTPGRHPVAADAEERELSNRVLHWLLTTFPPRVCDIQVTDGKAFFRDTTTHACRGMTLDLPEMPP